MFRKLAITALLLGATCVEAFAPGAPMARLPAMRSATCRNSKLALRMQGDNEEYRPIIPTTENPMAPDYAREPTQFERQGLVESNVNTAPGVMMGEGGLTRREALGAGGAVGIGSIALLWAVTRNSGYDQKDTSRDAGVAVVNTEAVATKEIQASIAGLKGNLAKLIEIQAAFLADPNAQVLPHPPALRPPPHFHPFVLPPHLACNLCPADALPRGQAREQAREQDSSRARAGALGNLTLLFFPLEPGDQ